MRRRVVARGSDPDVALEETLLVAAPDSLPDRLLLAYEWRQRRNKKRIVAAAAAAVLAAVAALVVYSPPPTLQTLGARHPAVAAIAEVVEAQRRVGPPAPRAGVYDDLRRLGLDLPRDAARVEYVGECRLVPRCQHIVVATARDRADVILAPDLPKVARMLVADQRKVALMSAARTGGFIVVGDSADAARRIEKLLRSAPKPQ